MFIRFIKDHKIAAILLVLLVLLMVVGVPLIINWMARIPAVTSFFVTSWSANDALSYYGSVLGFLSTVTLSGLALWQNHVIQEANDKHTELLEKMERIKNAPHLTVKSVLAHGAASNLEIKVENISDNIAENVTIPGIRLLDENGKVVWENEENITVDYLIEGREWRIKLENPVVSSTLHRFMFEIKYTDKFGSHYVGKAIGSFGEKVGLPTFKLTIE